MASIMRSIKELKRHQFFPADLSDTAFKVYSEGDEVFYEDSDGNFYEADNSIRTNAWLIGNLEDVEEYLMWAAEEE